MRQTAPGETRGVRPVMEVAFRVQPADRRLDFRFRMAFALQRPPDLLLRMVPPSQSRERPLVGAPARPPLGPRADGYSMSNDCIVFSISSAAMSEVDWMPWIFSLNSSGLLARRNASS